MATKTKITAVKGTHFDSFDSSRRPVIALDQVVVGHRRRKDMGDIDSLAASIEDIGLLHPITVDEQGRLLAGARRLAACKLLGWKDIPVNVARMRP